ncbi:MAG: glycosyltransferase [Hydrococcus sp. Prado102]|jgi:hypothetical protein|nr:glycosyltransferase [Hydrococcus sp. Prado102]
MNQEKPLNPLPYPVYFICLNPQKWEFLMNNEMPPPVEQLADRLIDGNEVWSVQTYIHLKRRGLEVYLVPNYVRGRICVTSYDRLKIRDFPFNSYVVTCRHDRARPEICEKRIVQNQLNIIDESDLWIPLWSQPNLIPRDTSRNSRIENITYKGLKTYLAQPFRSPEFLQQLESMGVNLSLSQTDTDWTDYTTADLVLAVRNCTEYDLSIKPPSKLINAWLAKCPALLGPEPAYQQLRESELDYIEVRSPDDVISAVTRLRENPNLYAAMVENGLKRVQVFTPDALALWWRDLLAGAIAQDYERWLSQSPARKLLGRPIQFVRRAIEHKREKKYFFININQGKRLFSL